MGAYYTRSACCQPKKIIRSTIPDDAGSIRGRSPNNNKDLYNTRRSKPRKTHTEQYRLDHDESYVVESEDDYNDTGHYLSLGEDSYHSYSAERISPQVTLSADEREENASALRAAVQLGNESLVMFYVEESNDNNLLNTTFPNGDTCLHVAVRNRSYNLIIYLISNGANPNQQNEQNGETPLHTAVRVRDTKLVSFLCKYKADASVTNTDFETPLSIASDNRDYDIVELLAPDTLAAIHRHCSTGLDREMVEKVMKDAEIEALDAIPKLPVIHSNRSHDHHDSHPEFDHMNTERLHTFTDDILNVVNNNNNNNKHDNDYSGDSKELEAEDVPSDIPSLEIQHMLSSEGFVAKLTDKEMLSMEATRIQRSNPFTKLKREQTKRMLEEMHQIAKSKDNLPVLQGWLEKRQPHVPYSWQKRWVVVKGGHFMWSERMKAIVNPKDRAQRKEFGQSINLMLITEIKLAEGKRNKKKFVIKLREGAAKRTEYTWKCMSAEDALFWRKGIRKHQKHLQSLQNFLGTKTSDAIHLQ